MVLSPDLAVCHENGWERPVVILGIFFTKVTIAFKSRDCFFHTAFSVRFLR